MYIYICLYIYTDKHMYVCICNSVVLENNNNNDV